MRGCQARRSLAQFRRRSLQRSLILSSLCIARAASSALVSRSPLEVAPPLHKPLVPPTPPPTHRQPPPPPVAGKPADPDAVALGVGVKAQTPLICPIPLPVNPPAAIKVDCGLPLVPEPVSAA
mmetsp:Transcript_3778/g.12046  ORF Transcript_3778/g.12046 Transcript_3778/m.12046 type:complete len:123 (+) Transcript_3778:735-1103(+)